MARFWDAHSSHIYIGVSSLWGLFCSSLCPLVLASVSWCSSCCNPQHPLSTCVFFCFFIMFYFSVFSVIYFIHFSLNFVSFLTKFLFHDVLFCGIRKMCSYFLYVWYWTTGKIIGECKFRIEDRLKSGVGIPQGMMVICANWLISFL